MRTDLDSRTCWNEIFLLNAQLHRILLPRPIQCNNFRALANISSLLPKGRMIDTSVSSLPTVRRQKCFNRAHSHQPHHMCKQSRSHRADSEPPSALRFLQDNIFLRLCFSNRDCHYAILTADIVLTVASGTILCYKGLEPASRLWAGCLSIP